MLLSVLVYAWSRADGYLLVGLHATCLVERAPRSTTYEMRQELIKHSLGVGDEN
jgi:hypothetical protein